MIIKTEDGHSHADDLEDVLQLVRRYDMCLSPAKCSFGVQAGKFMDFMLMMMEIKANAGKCQTIVDMRNSTNVMGVQQLTKRLVTKSRFLSYAGDKAFFFFVAQRKKEKFEWISNCEEAFAKIMEFLASLLILTRLKKDSLLLLYLSVIEGAMSSVLVQKIDKADRPVYFVSKLFKGVRHVSIRFRSLH